MDLYNSMYIIIVKYFVITFNACCKKILPKKKKGQEVKCYLCSRPLYCAYLELGDGGAVVEALPKHEEGAGQGVLALG